MASEAQMSRYGIWGMRPASPSVIERAMGTAEGVGKLFNQFGANRLQNLGIQEKQAMLPYLGRQEEAKLGYQNAMTEAEKARAGLYGVQGREAMGRLGLLQAQERRQDPVNQFNSLLTAFQNAKNPEQKMAYARMLEPYYQGGISGGGLGRQPRTTGPGGQMNALGAEGIETNPLQNQSRGSGKQAMIQNPDGTYTQVETPTQSSMSTSQNRAQTDAEVQSLRGVVFPGINPYQGTFGSIRLSKDLYDYARLPKDAKGMPTSKLGQDLRNKLVAFQTAKMYLPEYATANARLAAGGNSPTDTQIKSMQESLYNSLPGSTVANLMPRDLLAEAQQNYATSQDRAVQAYMQPERQDFPQTGEPLPPWAVQQQQNPGSQLPAEIRNVLYPEQQPQAQGQVQGQPQQQQAAQPFMGYSGQQIADTAKAYGVDIETAKQIIAKAKGPK